MAKNTPSAIVSGAGLLTAVWTSLVCAVRKAGGTDEDLHRLSTPEGEPLIEQIAQLIAGAKQAVRTIFKIVLDYSLSLEQMIKLGNYATVQSDITAQNFPVKGSGQVERDLELIHFDRNISTGDAFSELGRQGYRPATLEELLALGAKHPELQRQFPVVALGSVWRDRDGNEYVPYFRESFSGKRNLRLNWLGSGWDGVCRFLAVRK